jgi:hypothetical protein
MTNSHYSVFRWGTAQIWWTGTFEELKSFKEWVEQYVPENQFGWFATEWPKDEFAENHLSGWFKTNAWTFLVNWWADGKLGTRKPDGSLLEWEAANGTPQYGTT